jgi:hypothetical protein
VLSATIDRVAPSLGEADVAAPNGLRAWVLRRLG